MKSFSFLILNILITFCGLGQISTSMSNTQSADIILINGKIFTSDTNQLYVEALAIKGNRVLSVGTNTAIEKLSSSKTKRIDLKGETVVPGFNNAHEHLGSSAPLDKFFRVKEFSDAGPDKGAVLDSIKRLVKSVKPGQ